MKIFVKPHDGETILLPVSERDTIWSVKKCLQERHGIDPKMCRLKYDGERLENGKSLENYKIKDGDTIKMTKKFQIFVTNVAGKSFNLQVEGTDLVKAIKAKIEIKEGITPDAQRLIYGGKQLEDESNLRNYNIQKDSTIHCVARLEGGKAPFFVQFVE